jgi:hypothetical protein
LVRGKLSKPIFSVGFEARTTKYMPNLIPTPCQQFELGDFGIFV